MRFKAIAWKTGNSLFLTVPASLEVKEGQRFLVEVEEVRGEAKENVEGAD
jgi:hypothetical protein